MVGSQRMATSSSSRTFGLLSYLEYWPPRSFLGLGLACRSFLHVALLVMNSSSAPMMISSVCISICNCLNVVVYHLVVPEYGLRPCIGKKAPFQNDRLLQNPSIFLVRWACHVEMEFSCQDVPVRHFRTAIWSRGALGTGFPTFGPVCLSVCLSVCLFVILS